MIHPTARAVRPRSAPAKRPARPKNAVRALSPVLEPLEGRALMAVTRLSLLAMQSQTLGGSLASPAASERYKVPLKAGDILTIDVDPAAANSDLKLVIRDRSGRAVFSADDGKDPDTGRFTRDPSGSFRAATSGTYSVIVSGVRGGAKVLDPPATPPTARAPVAFSVGFRRFALSELSASNNPLQNDASNTHADRWSWISGDTLFLSDAAGNGFGIKANWNQKVVTHPDGTMSSVYTTDGPMSIGVNIPPSLAAGRNGKTAVVPGEVITLPMNGAMTIATNAGFNGDRVGTVQTTSFGDQANFPGGTASAEASARASSTAAVGANAFTSASLNATALLNNFASRYGLSVSGAGTSFGMGLGRDLGFLNAPLRGDGTYFYVQKTSGYSASFGGVTAGVGSGVFTLIVDPADPFVYARVGDRISFGASIKGLIPYTAAASNYNGPSLSGHLFGRVTGVQVADLPINIDGDITLNIDANNDGVPYGLNGNASTLFRRGGLAASVVQDIKVGANGTINFGTKISGIDVSFPLGSASLGYVPGQRSNTLVETVTVRNLINGATSTIAVNRTALPADLPADYQVPPTKFGGGTFPLQEVRYYALERGGGLGTRLQVAGATTNPLAGTPLASAFSGNQFMFRASSTGFSPTELVSNFSASLSYRSGGGLSLGGFRLGGPSQSLNITADRNQINVGASLNVFAGNLTLNGSLRPNNGSFLLTGGFDRGNSLIPIPSLLNVANGSFTLANNFPGYANGFSGNLNLGFNYSAAGFGIAGGVSGSLIIQPGFNISGRFSAFGEARSPDVNLGLFTIPGVRLSLNVGVGFDSSSITIDMPSPIPDLRIAFR